MKRSIHGKAQETREAGGALLMSLTAMVVVSILAAAFLQLSTAISRRMGAGTDSLQAFNIAEAGLAEAYTGLAVARTGNVGSEAAPAVFAGGLFWVTATEHDNGLVELESTALYGTGRAKLGLVCEPVTSDVGSLGIFSGSGMALESGVLVDSYDSSLGAYAEQVGGPSNQRALVGSNGDVSLARDSAVHGDVAHGTQGQLSKHAKATLTGSASARAQDGELPAVEVPEVSLSPSLPAAQSGKIVLPPGEYGYQSASLTRGIELVLEGPLTLVLGGLNAVSGSQLTFDTSAGPIQLYVTGNLDLASGSSVTTSSQATSDTVVMVSTPDGGTVNFGSTSQFYGFVYVPETGARIGAAYEIFGGVVGKQIVLEKNARVHMDLAQSSSLDSVLPLMHGWRVIEVPQALAVAQLDPFRLLGLDKSQLRKPAEAHADQLLELKYLDLQGATRSYLGLESDFDWSQVREVLSGARDGQPYLIPPEPVAATPAPDPGKDLVDSASSSSRLRDDLIAMGSISNDALIYAMNSGKLVTSMIGDVLDFYSPLELPVVLAAIRSAQLDSGKLTDVLVGNSPLSVEALNEALRRNPPLNASDLSRLLSYQ